ncbi:MAG: ABC transporter permease [bacterium]|nr:ABC transporter permease [bacterium]
MTAVTSIWDWFLNADNWTGSSGVPARVVEHLWISARALIIAFAIALPLGVWLGHKGKYGTLVTTIGNLGRAIPTFALLIILASWETVGVSDLAAIIALAIFAIPPVLTNAFVGVRDTDRTARESARGMGMTGTQVLWRVELPLSVPVVAAGIRTSTVQVVATATLAALVGGGGLGRFVVDGFGRQDTTLMLAGVILVAIVCVTIELVLGRVQQILTPRPLRGSRIRSAF